MKTISIPLKDNAYHILRLQGAANDRSPEIEAQAILYRACEENVDVVRAFVEKMKEKNPPSAPDDEPPPLPIIDDLQEIENMQAIIHGEGGVAVYTYDPSWRESFFLDRSNNTGYTGDWRLSPGGLKGGVIVIYFSQINNGRIDNIIYKARITEAISCPDAPNRYKIHFENWEIVGKTHSMWKEFAKTGSNPIKYF